eukprot:1678791-Pyramimonas_sp.AAC.1
MRTARGRGRRRPRGRAPSGASGAARGCLHVVFTEDVGRRSEPLVEVRVARGSAMAEDRDETAQGLRGRGGR